MNYTTNLNENDLNKLYNRKENYITSKLKTLDKDVRRMQSNLLEMIMSDYAGKFDVKPDGTLKVTQKNMRLATEIEALMDRFNTLFQQSKLKRMANDMLKITDYSKDYYAGMGYSNELLESIDQGMGYISQSIGITDKGNIIKGSYLDSLSQNAEVRKELKEYVINSVASGKGYNDYLKGFKELVVGNQQTAGALQKYYSQFAYDSFNQVDASVNKHYADELQLEYFIYAGGIIDTTRPFCRKRAGKVFSVEETKKWKCDPDLIGKPKGVKCDDGYNALIERGRYRCRHSIRYISEEMAFKRRPELKNK
jgi:hypothetical protein